MLHYKNSMGVKIHQIFQSNKQPYKKGLLLYSIQSQQSLKLKYFYCIHMSHFKMKNISKVENGTTLTQKAKLLIFVKDHILKQFDHIKGN